jgi:hypothetical protein
MVVLSAVKAAVGGCGGGPLFSVTSMWISLAVVLKPLPNMARAVTV